MENRMRNIASLIPSAVILVFMLLITSCATARLESRLDPASEDFFSKVRYIITQEESKIFLELPASDRTKFIEEFWKRRDPTPGTERNEFEEAYFARIEEANHLFRGSRPGWLQDRGRIYILFGPPNERQTNPMGGRVVDPYVDPREMVEGREAQRLATGEKATEIWVYYNLFSSLQRPQAIRLVFVDSHGTGDYQLTTNLDEIIPGTMGIETQFAPNLILMHELHKEEDERAKQHLKRTLFNFSWEFIRQKNRELGSNLLIHLFLPYEKIIFEEKKNRLEAKMLLEIQLKNAADEIIWRFEDYYTLDFSEKLLEQMREGKWEVDVPVKKWLNKGKYSVYLHLKNLSGDQEIKKLVSLKM